MHSFITCLEVYDCPPQRTLCQGIPWPLCATEIMVSNNHVRREIFQDWRASARTTSARSEISTADSRHEPPHAAAAAAAGTPAERGPLDGSESLVSVKTRESERSSLADTAASGV